MGASGILDTRRDFEVGTAEAQAVLRKRAQAEAVRRDRELADANLTLAQARSAYVVGWAQMGAEDSQWKLEQSDLPIQGSLRRLHHHHNHRRDSIRPRCISNDTASRRSVEFSLTRASPAPQRRGVAASPLS